jgi:hypothetical protein
MGDQNDRRQPFDGVAKRPVSPAVALALPQYAVYGYGILFDALGKLSVRVHRVSDLWGRPSASNAEGSRVSRECSVEFVIPWDHIDRIEALRTHLTALGWAVSVRENEPDPAEPSGTWVTGTRAVDGDLVSSISAIDREMEEVATALGVEYDGHGFARVDPET